MPRPSDTAPAHAAVSIDHKYWHSWPAVLMVLLNSPIAWPIRIAVSCASAGVHWHPWCEAAGPLGVAHPGRAGNPSTRKQPSPAAGITMPARCAKRPDMARRPRAGRAPTCIAGHGRCLGRNLHSAFETLISPRNRPFGHFCSIAESQQPQF